ncbi:hypothetical protein [Tabrizicola sp.]|uniref:hypothetical protein n=1 Tax=Tabrizicola sp. TaxID=2005166 RepID=UPI0035AF3520
MRIWLFLLCLWPIAAFAEETDDFYTAPANPLNLTLALEDDSAETAILGPDGGKLKLKNAAGDSFVLTFPEGALLTDTRITATPIATTSGLPEGTGAITGLVLKPDGLELAATATLEITPKAPIPPAGRLHWGFYEDGSDAFLHIPLQGTDSIILPIDHFSGAGVSFADRANLQLDRWRQQRAEDRLSTRVAELIRESAAEAKVTGEDDTAKGREAGEIMKGEVTRMVLSGWLKLAASPAADCATVEAATRSINAIDKQRQLLGISESVADGEVMRQLFDRYWAVCFPEKVKICQSTGDLPQLAAFGLAYDRQRQLVGISGEAVADPARSAELRAAMEACGRYKLTVNASGQWKDNAGVYGTTAYKIEVPIRLQFTNPDLLTYTLEGEGPPTAQSVTFVDYACWKLDSSHGGAPMLARLQSLEFRDDHTPLRVDLKLRAAEVMAVITCPTNRFRKTIENDVAWVVWAVAHRKDRVDRGFGLKTMKAGSHPKIFTYSWEGKGEDQGTTASDTTALTLEHIGG